MSEPTKADVEKIKDLYGLCHDLIAQAQYRGHAHGKVMEALNFLRFQYETLKQKAEGMAKIEVVSETPAIPVVGTDANKAVTAETLATAAQEPEKA